MTTPANVALHVVVNGGAPQTSAPTCAFEDVIVLQLGSTAGVQTAKYRIREYPDGFSCPAGWTEESGGIYSVTRQSGAAAPSFELPLETYWGKYFFDVTVNELTRNGASASDLYAKNALKIPSKTGIEDIGYLETNEFDTLRHYIAALKHNLRLFDANAVRHRVMTASGYIISGNMTIDFNEGLSVTLILDANITGTLTLVPPALAADQATCPKLCIKQAGGGSKTIAAWSGAVWVAGTAPTLSTASGTVNVITAVVDGTDNIMRFVSSPATGAGFPS